MILKDIILVFNIHNTYIIVMVILIITIIIISSVNFQFLQFQLFSLFFDHTLVSCCMTLASQGLQFEVPVLLLS